MSAAALPPLRVGDILGGGLRMYRRNMVTMLALAAAVVIPLSVLTLVVDLVVVKSSQGVPGDPLLIGTTAARHVNQAAQSLAVVIGRIIAALSVAVCVVAASDSQLDKEVRTGKSLRGAFARVGPIIWQYVLIYVGLIVALIAFVVPAIYLYVAWSVALPVLLVEGAGARTSLIRSRSLIKGRWWRVAGVALATTAATLVLGDGFVALLRGAANRAGG